MELHPYYPIGIDIPGYKPNDRPLVVILGYFSIGVAAVLAGAFAVARYLRPSISCGDLFIVLWFALSAALHCGFEGYLITHLAQIPGAQDVLSQLWKEYSKSDSRYLTADAFVTSIETVTVVVWGPLCFLVAYLTIVDHPLRHPLQIIASVAHLYGATLYYATSFFDQYVHGVPHGRPEPLYYWVYFILMNLPWVIVPAFLIRQSLTAISGAIRTVNHINAQKKSR